MAQWQRIVATTISKYLKGEQNSILRRRKLLQMLESKGRISFNNTGRDLVFPVEYRRNSLQTYSDMQALTFSRFNRHKTATIPWVALIIPEAFSKLETLVNRGNEALVKAVSDIAKKMANDLREGFGSELYLDGYDTANAGHLYGIKSFLGSGTLGTGANNFADGVYQASDTYAGLDTTQGGHGGTWSGQWPSGDGDAAFDFWSPLILKYSDTAFDPTGTSTTTWAANCVKAMRFAVAHGNRNMAKSGDTDIFVMPTDLFSQLQQTYDSKERVMIASGSGGGAKLSAGFAPEMSFDGVDVAQDFGVPSGEVFGLNVMSMEIRSLQDQLFTSSEPKENVADLSWRLTAEFWGNAAFYSPRDFVHLKST